MISPSSHSLRSIPYILRQPWLGVVVGAWISLMNPHRYAFGFANNFPFALIIAILTVAAVVFGRKKIEFPWHPITVMILVLMFWFTVTLLFALEPENAWGQWVQVMRSSCSSFCRRSYPLA